MTPRRTTVTRPAALELAGLDRDLTRLERLLSEPEERLRTTVAAVSGWNAAEQAFHMVLALDLSLRNVASLVRDQGRLVREPQNRKPEALAVLTRGRIPRGVGEAPRFAQPPARFELSLLLELFNETRTTTATLAEDPAAIDAAPRAVPHQLLGDLTAVEWVRFARMHTAHHLVIAREVLAAVG